MKWTGGGQDDIERQRQEYVPPEVTDVMVQEGDETFKKLSRTALRDIHPTNQGTTIAGVECITVELRGEGTPDAYTRYDIPVEVARKLPWYGDFMRGEYHNWGNGFEWRIGGKRVG